MSSRRTAKLARAIQEVVSTTILFELKDPRVKHVTVTQVEVAGDLRSAKVFVSVMGDEKTQSLSLHGLKSARGFLQSKVADHLQTRYTPILTFVLDSGIKRSFQASQILDDVLTEQQPDPEPAGSGDGSPAKAQDPPSSRTQETVSIDGETSE